VCVRVCTCVYVHARVRDFILYVQCIVKPQTKNNFISYLWLLKLNSSLGYSNAYMMQK